MKLYQLYDKVAKKFRNEIMFAETGAMAIRNNLNWIIAQIPLKDLELWEIGYQDENGNVHVEEKCENYVFVDWKNYKFPETKAEALEPLQAKEIIDNLEKHN